MVIKCDICGKEFKNSQGLRGHKTFVHDKASSSSNSSSPAPAQQLSTAVAQPVETVGDLTELRADLDGVLDEVSILSQQFSMLINEVKTLLTLRNLVQEQGTQYSQQLEQLKSDWIPQIKHLEDNTTAFHQLMEKQLSATQNELSNTGQRVNKLTESVLVSKESVNAIEKAVSQVKGRVDPVERGLASVMTELAVIKNKLDRQPTGKLVEMEIKGKPHLYKEYWSGKGLVKPHLQCDDLIFGKRWVDLAEPED